MESLGLQCTKIKTDLQEESEEDVLPDLIYQ